MPISLITINITKAIYLVCSENRQQRLVDAGCFKFGRQDPDFLLLLILSANEECFLTCSDTILMWEPVPQTCATNMREQQWREMQGVVYAELC